jgi:histidyl-tRNA synthetase
VAVSQRISGVKGMSDLLPSEIGLWQHVESVARRTFGAFGYQEIRTPIVEDTALFVRGVGEATDIVGKEMYTFEDKGGRSLSLRPEGTAPAARAYIEHSVVQKEPVTRWFYIGPMFRYERMKTGRYRQFWQIGAEAFGAKEPAQDVELMDLVRQFLEALPLSGVMLHVNSLGDETCRPEYQKQLVAYFQSRREDLCAECKERLERNPLRILDCKNPTCQGIAQAAPSVLEFLCAACAEHFEEVKRQLQIVGIRYEVNPRMVRGLDYYTRTAFEFIAEDPVLGTASAVGGGGRYDRLVRELGGPDVPAVGFALGVDRLVLLLQGRGERFEARPDLFVAVADDAARDEALKLVSSLRRQGFAVETDPRGGSLKSQMKRADRTQARFTLVLGGNEVSSGEAQLKPMAGGEPLSVKLDSLAAELRRFAPR